MTQAARRALLAFLLPALLLAQTLGLLHATVHGGTSGVQSVAAAQAAATPQARGWVADLFGSHGDASSCRLFDQSSHGDAAPVAAPVVAALPVACPFAAIALPAIVVAIVAPFDARGPPALR